MFLQQLLKEYAATMEHDATCGWHLHGNPQTNAFSNKVCVPHSKAVLSAVAWLSIRRLLIRAAPVDLSFRELLLLPCQPLQSGGHV